MHEEPTASPITLSRTGVCVVDGYGISVSVHRGRLMVSDGVGPHRRRSEFARATCPIKRLVLLGHTGYLSLEALRWLTDVGVGFVQLDAEGRVLATSAGSGLDDPRLRRAQALAWGTPTATVMARDLLKLKLAGQADVARRYGRSETGALIRRLSRELAHGNTPAQLMTVEAAAASSYWQAWADMPVNWIRRDRDRVPQHWKSIGDRTSPLTASPRTAATPAHAIWNYTLAILQSEATLACLAMGLDPGLGVLHADQKARDSAALDVCEALRPAVDAYVLGLIEETVFRADDFVETRRGSCRLLRTWTHRLAETSPIWRAQLAPVVEQVARTFASLPGSRVDSLPTKLSGSMRSSARARLHGTVKPRHHRPKAPKAIPYCHSCGAEVRRGQRFCDSCRPAALATAAPVSIAAARRRRMELRALGQDPATSEQALAKLGASQAKRRAEERAWDAEHGQRPSPSLFRERILPSLAGVPLSRLAAASGLSIPYLSKVRAGKSVPHPRWWPVLQQAAGTRA